jgi:hypothetical protein
MLVESLILSVGGVVAISAILWMISRIRYRVTADHLEISVLGFALRRIPIRDIRKFSRQGPPFLAERWVNTLRPGRRVMVLERRRGFPKHVLITPQFRYELQHHIRQVMKASRLNGHESDGTELLVEEETTFSEDRTSRERKAAAYLDRPHA